MFSSMSMERRIRFQLEAKSKEELIAARDSEALKGNELRPDFLRLINEILLKKFLVGADNGSNKV